MRAVRQPEAGNVDRVGSGVLAPVARAAAVDAPARIAAEMLDPLDPRAEMLLRGGLEDIPLPHRQRGRHRA